MLMNNEHLTLDEYIKFIETPDTKDIKRAQHKILYGLIIEKWERPSDWIESMDRKIVYCGLVSNTYWYNWSLCNNEKLPLDFIKKEKQNRSQKILKMHVVDYNELEKAILDLTNIYTCSYSRRLFSSTLRICLFLGFNDIKSINFNDLSKSYISGLFDSKQLYFMEILMQHLGESDTETIKGELRKKILRKEQKNKEKPCWSFRMLTVIDDFLNDMENSKVCLKTRMQKQSHINLFGFWLLNSIGNALVEDLKCVDTYKWHEYVSLTIGITELSGKTRDARLISLMQFFDWIKVKRTDIISKKLVYSRSDFKILETDNSDDNLSFEKREHGEKILYYLINNYKSYNIVEHKIILDEFCKEMIIISANSGMRLSEIINMEYKSVFFSEDEKNYKMVINYVDKLGQINRPVYFTKDGYEAVERLEKLREKSGELKKQYNKRTKTSFIHLFQFEENSTIYYKYIYEFFTKIKYVLNLVNDDGRCVKGNVHAFRHFFGLTVFRLSKYNISVVRYLLGHRSYMMSEKYLVEENKLLFSKIREKNDVEKVTGKGIDTFYDLVYGSLTKKGQYNKLERYIGSDQYLSEIINEKGIKKITLGYCLNPCGLENRCYKCNNWLVTEKEINDLFSFLKDLIGIIGFRIEKTNLSIEEAISIPLISQDIDDAIILIEELKNLGVLDNEVNDKLSNKNMEVLL